MRPMILVLSLVLGIVPLFGVAWIFVSGMITLSPFSCHGRPFYDPDPADPLRVLSAECVLGNADKGLIGKKPAPAVQNSSRKGELTMATQAATLSASRHIGIGGRDAARIHALVA